MQSFLHNFWPPNIFAQFGKEVRFLPHVKILSFVSRQKIVFNWQIIGGIFIHLTKWTQKLFVNCEPRFFLQSFPAITVWLFFSTILFSFTKVCDIIFKNSKVAGLLQVLLKGEGRGWYAGNTNLLIHNQLFRMAKRSGVFETVAIGSIWGKHIKGLATINQQKYMIYRAQVQETQSNNLF